jgi:hypothetical protein
MTAPRFSAYTMPESARGFSPMSQALKIVLAIGIVVFCLAIGALARDLIAGYDLDEVAVFWSAWALVAGSLALMLLRLPR